MNNGQESELIIIEGNVSRITFRNDENGYSVFTLIKDNNKEERCVGSFIELHEGDRLELKGRYIEHAKYGKQFSVKTYKTVEPLFWIFKEWRNSGNQGSHCEKDHK